MTTISHFLAGDHRRCDDLFVEAERLVDGKEFAAARAAFEAFHAAMEHHFAMEESALFPAFEQATGQSAGPTAVMRHEHGQMRQLFEDMEHALTARQGEDFLGASETLLILMQQHNMKEEQILYAMSDRLLPGAELVARMRQVGA